MSKTIEVTVSPKGETTIQTKGFAGGVLPRCDSQPGSGSRCP